jgi:mRNA interferase RelE/StbE
MSATEIRVSKAILALEENPFPHGCKKLKNRDGFRIRIGDYRVLYFADAKAKQIVIGVIGHRREVYRD